MHVHTHKEFKNAQRPSLSYNSVVQGDKNISQRFSAYCSSQ